MSVGWIPPESIQAPFIGCILLQSQAPLQRTGSVAMRDRREGDWNKCMSHFQGRLGNQVPPTHCYSNVCLKPCDGNWGMLRILLLELRTFKFISQDASAPCSLLGTVKGRFEVFGQCSNKDTKKKISGPVFPRHTIYSISQPHLVS